MKVIALKGISQVGKSQVVAGLVYGATVEGVTIREIEFSDSLVGITNRALQFQPASGEQLERMLLKMLRYTFDLDLPDRVPDFDPSEPMEQRIQRDIMRRDFLDWTRTIPPNFQLTAENKDKNRIILTWLAIFGRYVARDNGIFARPVLRRLKADELAGAEYACVGGMRFPEEFASIRTEHEVSVVEVRSSRRPEDLDLANVRRDEIAADTIYHANFRTPEDSFRFSSNRLWPDFYSGNLAASYGTPA